MKRRHTERVDVPAHELLHGAWLVLELLDRVGLSGELGSKRDHLFERHPAARAAFERAQEACHALYQAAGDIALSTPSRRRKRRARQIGGTRR